jgi:hypothetical protein
MFAVDTIQSNEWSYGSSLTYEPQIQTGQDLRIYEQNLSYFGMRVVKRSFTCI